MRDDRRQTHRESLQAKSAARRALEESQRVAREKEAEKERRTLEKLKSPTQTSAGSAWLNAIYKKAPRLQENTYESVLKTLVMYPSVRDLASWEPKGKGRETQFRSLCSHLFATYQMPPFLWSAFDAAPYTSMLVHFVLFVAKGGSVSEGVKKGLIPFPLTRKMCHALMQTTGEYTILQGVRRTQIRELGGSERFYQTWMQTAVGDQIGNKAEEAFWATVIEWFAKFPMVDMSQVSPMVDFIRFRRANEPNFSMKGRTVLALLRDTQEWHAQLSKTRINQVREFKPSGFMGYDVVKTRTNEYRTEVQEFWQIEELLSNKSLSDEGRVLKHCVLSYAYSVEHGYNSIWSLTLDGQKTLTIEVHNNSRKVVQVRGKYNRLASSSGNEVQVLLEWARRNNLQVNLGARW